MLDSRRRRSASIERQHQRADEQRCVSKMTEVSGATRTYEWSWNVMWPLGAAQRRKRHRHLHAVGHERDRRRGERIEARQVGRAIHGIRLVDDHQARCRGEIEPVIGAEAERFQDAGRRVLVGELVGRGGAALPASTCAKATRQQSPLSITADPRERYVPGAADEEDMRESAIQLTVPRYLSSHASTSRIRSERRCLTSCGVSKTTWRLSPGGVLSIRYSGS